MIAKGKPSIALDDILSIMTEADILSYYLNVSEVPCIISSPLREDKNPSFGLYSLDRNRIYYTDLSTKDKGGLFDLLGQMWGCDYYKVLGRIYKDKDKIAKGHQVVSNISCKVKSIHAYNKNTDLQCKAREWKDYDLEYWGSYGITLEWLQYAEVYPISHKIVIKNGVKHIFGADKYAYAYVERKEGKVTLKIYQPFNKLGYKWSNKHDGSVISLWTKVPPTGDVVVICSSLKDALCLSANTKIPAIAIQGEGYSMSETAIKELKRRYNNIFVCLDNDVPGLLDAEKLSKETGFVNAVIPHFDGGKDLSDYYKVCGKDAFLKLAKKLFTLSFVTGENSFDDVPF